MRLRIGSKDSKGFAAVEGILIVVIIAAVIGITYYVIHQKNTADKTLSTGNTASSNAAAAPGTTSDISQITEQDANTEASVDHSGDGQIQSNLTNANNSTSQTGSAYNESNL